ncbi:MAG: PAS domain S-box protein [Deltaproteobacteria bacterium]|nr:PAS domain S-box protein [Deltaproteobacteria bacterium]
MKTVKLSAKSVTISLVGTVIIITIIYLAFLSHKSFKKTMVSYTYEHLLNVAKSTARSVEAYIIKHMETLHSVAKYPFFEDHFIDREILKDVYDLHKKEVEAVYLLDSHGIILHRYPSKEDIGGKTEVNLPERPDIAYFLKEHKPFISEVFHYESGKNVVFIAEPIFRKNRFMGIIGWTVSMDNLSKRFIQPVKVGKRGYAWLMDKDGLTLCHPNCMMVGEDLLKMWKKFIPEQYWADYEKFLKKMTRGEEGVEIYDIAWEEKERIVKETKLVGYAPVHIGNELWSTGISMLYYEISGPINSHAINLIGLSVLVIALFGTGGVVLFRTQKRRAELETESKYLKEIAASAEALRKSEIRYRTLFESATDAIFILSIDGRPLAVNRAACDQLGYSREEMMRLSPEDVLMENPDERLRLIDDLKKLGQIVYEKSLLRRDGSIVPVEESARLIEFAGETAILIIARDISERKNAEEEKKRLEAQLIQAQRMEAIGTLAAGIAHNFNNLLMGIQGNASIALIDTDSNHPHYKHLKNIEKLVQSGAKLTGQLLGYAREGRYDVRPISLNQLVKEVSETFGTAKKEIRFHYDLAEDLFGIKADRGQIEQILMNLFVNAADAMPDGGDLFIQTMNVTHENMTDRPYIPKPGNYVLLTVRDTGIGMDKKTMKRIFEPFFTTKGLARGTGLGLASAYGIVKAHSGYIDVDSEKGHGTTFSIFLPSTTKAVKEEIESTSVFLKGGETILLVDDEDMVIEAGEQILPKLGYEVLLARGGQEALELYRQNHDKIDMVLLDMVMPDLGGGETYDRMKEINPDVKVLLSSGYSIDGQAKEIMDRGCDGFIQKPYTLKKISGAIREVLEE